MIICPECQSELNLQKAGYFCSACSKRADIVDGIVMFHPKLSQKFKDYPHHVLDDHHKNTSKHFWFQSRKKIILDYFQQYFSQSDRIIEIGAGTGDVAREMNTAGFRLGVGEVHKNGLMYAKKYGIEELYQFDIRKSPFIEEYDGVGIFDVIQHIEEDELVLKNINKMLKPGGRIILTTAGHMWLWSRLDDEISIKRRYERKEIEYKLKKAGFEIMYSNYFFFSIVPLLWLRKYIHKSNKNPSVTQKTFDLNPFVNTTLRLIMSIERMVLRYIKLPVGGSVLIVAKKI